MATKKQTPDTTDIPDTTKARVLVDGVYGLVDEVIEIPADGLATAEASGQVDTHPDAVAYAESLKAA